VHKCIYTVLTCDPRWAAWETVKEYASTCLRTLSAHHSDCTLLVAAHGDMDEIQEVLSSFDGHKQLSLIPDEDFDTRLDKYKVKSLLRMPLRAGDAIIMLDLDTLVTGLLFDSFQYEFDIAFTQRADWHPVYVVNIGYVAMRWNAMTRKFVTAWAREAMAPKVPGFVKFLDMVHASQAHTTCDDQDFICWMLRHSMFGDGRLCILPAEYNYFPFEEDDIEAYRAAMAPDSGNRLIHFRGADKSLSTKLAKEFGL